MAAITISVDGAAGSDVALAFEGKLLSTIEAQFARMRGAYKTAMDKGVTQPGKRRLRATIEATGFYKAGSLAKTWRGTTFDDRPDDGPAAFFKTSAPEIVNAFEDGVTITAHNTKFLAIPLGPAKAIIHDLNRGINRTRGALGRFSDEGDPTERVAARLGVTLVPLINQSTGQGVLVAESGLRLTPGGRKAKRQEGGATPLFALVRQATLKPRPMGREVLRGLRSGFEGEFASALASELPSENR